MAFEQSLEPSGIKKPKPKEQGKVLKSPESNPAGDLQSLVGNRTLQRLIAQKSGNQEATDLDDGTADRIKQQRQGGQPLEQPTQERMEAAMGYDFSQVRVHNGPEADELNQQLGAKAFTTGQDIFFRGGAYDPQAAEGQRLIAHELAHVVQQGTGAVSGGGGRMTVNPPGDTFEQQADSVAQAATNPGPQVQRQEEEEELIQAQEDTEEEELVQMQEETEEEELIQMQSEEEEEEEEELMP
jgi:hypothetical protein